MKNISNRRHVSLAAGHGRHAHSQFSGQFHATARPNTKHRDPESTGSAPPPFRPCQAPTDRVQSPGVGLPRTPTWAVAKFCGGIGAGTYRGPAYPCRRAGTATAPNPSRGGVASRLEGASVAGEASDVFYTQRVFRQFLWVRNSDRGGRSDGDAPR